MSVRGYAKEQAQQVAVALALAWRQRSAYAVYWREVVGPKQLLFLGVIFSGKVAKILEENGYVIRLIQ